MNNSFNKLFFSFISFSFLIVFFQACFKTDNSQYPSENYQYVGRSSCIECHKKEYQDWKGSDHDKAMDFANDSSVLGNFNNATLIRPNGQVHKAYKKGNKFFVYTDGEDGKMHEYEVKYVFGHYPLQNYLVEFPGGRLQTLALTWNSKDKNWYYMADSVYKGLSVDHNDWLHWTNHAQNWNSMCADCHSTNVHKNYDEATDSYHTTYSEIDVSCEACHGPASEHLKWAKLPETEQKKFANYALPLKTSKIDHTQFVDNCARCHSRRTAFSDFNGKEQNIYNHILPNLPTEPYWYIDGQIHDEDYVYASFTQSRMFHEKVQCNNCHNIHSGKLKMQGNALCLQCHEKQKYDVPTHTFHKGYGEKGKGLISAAGVKFEVGSGTECINCHMHGQNYMGVDYRRDHSFRIPRPDLSDKLGTPNACNQCHTDKSNKWAADYIEKWFGKKRPFQYGEAFYAAVNSPNGADSLLHKIMDDTLSTNSIKAIALSYFSTNAKNDDFIKKNLHNPNAQIRIAAIKALIFRSAKDVEAILPLLNDSLKAVRIEAAFKLSNVDSSFIVDEFKPALKKALNERLASLKYNVDFPTGKYNLANYYYNQKDYLKAEYYYKKAIEQDSELNAAVINLSYLYGVTGKTKQAEQLLAEYVKKYPNDANGLYNYGLVLSENKKYEESLKYLLKAERLMPENARPDYNIAKLYDFLNDRTKAVLFFNKAIQKEPENPQYPAELIQFYLKNNNINKAKELQKIYRKKFPAIEFFQNEIR